MSSTDQSGNAFLRKYFATYHIFSNKGSQCLINFETVTCGAS